MRILAVGDVDIIAEFKLMFSSYHEFHSVQPDSLHTEDLKGFDVVFDLNFQDHVEMIEFYNRYNHLILFVHIPKTSLSQVYHIAKEIRPTIYAINALPSMLHRDVLEVSIRQASDRARLEEACNQLDVKFLCVEDRVGMVTPRVISMIINEAYFTVQEGTASKTDIDQAMKLGTNYPHGPFEWCEKIGIKQVYELLEAVYEDTKDERYKICPLLKKEYLSFTG